jgi:hypothetical protein
MKNGQSSNSLVKKILPLAVPLVMLTAGCSLKDYVITKNFNMYPLEKEQSMNPDFTNFKTLSAEDLTKKYQDSVNARYKDSLLTIYNYQQAINKKVRDSLGYTTLRATFPLRR